MTKVEVLEKLTEIFKNNFDENDVVLSEETTPDDIDGWDSVEMINLIVVIQDVFAIKFNIDEILAMKSVGNMIDFILHKTKK